MIHLLHDNGRGIDRYFAGVRDASTIRRTFARVWSCKSCRRRYERHLLVERVLPAGPAEDGGPPGHARLWQTIEATVTDTHARPRVTPARAALLVGAFAAIVLVVGLRRAPFSGGEPVARGPASEIGDTAKPTLYLYRNVGGKAQPVGKEIRRDDGILVAYTNPSDLAYLMVFAVDEKGDVHWYYPPYERRGENPLAVPIRTRAVGVELGEEIHHTLPAGSLVMTAIFLPDPRHVLDVERSIAESRARGAAGIDAVSGLAGPGGFSASLPLEVVP